VTSGICGIIKKVPKYMLGLEQQGTFCEKLPPKTTIQPMNEPMSRNNMLIDSTQQVEADGNINNFSNFILGE
jgi:hypothetical protein